MTSKPGTRRLAWPAWLDGFLLGIFGAMVMAGVTAPWGSSHGVLGLGRVTGLGIALVFALHGAQVSRERLHAGSRNLRLHVLIQSATYIAFPLLGVCGFWLLRPYVTPPLALGFFYLCALPSTIASAVTLVGIARGNVPAAIFNATLSGLLGIFITPALASLVAATSGVHLSLLDAMRALAFTVLLPFAAGHGLQSWLLPWLRSSPRFVRFIERGAILLVMYVAFCDAVAADVFHQVALGSLLLVLLAAGALLAAMLTGLRWVGEQLRLPREDAVTLLLCGSQKSLANGMPMAKALFGAYPFLGLLVLPMIAFHQAQLIAGAIIARRHAARFAPADSDGGP